MQQASIQNNLNISQINLLINNNILEFLKNTQDLNTIFKIKHMPKQNYKQGFKFEINLSWWLKLGWGCYKWDWTIGIDAKDYRCMWFMGRRRRQHMEPYVIACWRLSPTRSSMPMSSFYISVGDVIYSHRKWDISSPQVSIIFLLSLALSCSLLVFLFLFIVIF